MKILLYLTSLIFLIFFIEIEHNKSGKYHGNIKVRVFTNNESLFGIDCILYNNYLFETNSTLKSNEIINIDKDGTQVTTQSSSETITGYNLINLKDSSYCAFGNNADSAIFLSKLPLNKKKLGIMPIVSPEIKDYLDYFVAEKDTTIGKTNYTLLMCNAKNSKKPLRQGVQKIILYLNKDLKEFPFHPFSKMLDDKFNGIVDKAVLVATDGSSGGLEFKYSDGLSKADNSRILMFINEDKKHHLE